MSKNSLEEAHANISNVIYQAILNPHFNKETIVQVCDASKQNGFAGLCTSLANLTIARERLGSKSTTKLISVIAFPFGFIPTSNKQKEAEYAIEKGADELDLVPNYFALKEGNIELFAEEINQISELGIPVRVIIDANILINSSKLSMAIDALIDAGAIGIQIGNGFGPSVSKDQTKHVSKLVKNRCSIKAVGGIKTFDQAIEIIEAGSTYIGTSFGFEITQEQKKKE
ncbi:deoxyribose-phosphate aldolase [Prochlorococcus marinus]|uniref:Deoxyribose-phosphate aldolase n=1 Tax=Prochlorococcus marinus str. PAC1 TaxID=59924 RepID=A0A0A2C121_PROMR|nr:deoxyribose-phosphate aldolase [Prochlorococcus marinus]KGG19217.1 Deoxyribose-phosphate aldolase [Prochlorococcus marinus str. PAC1]